MNEFRRLQRKRQIKFLSDRLTELFKQESAYRFHNLPGAADAARRTIEVAAKQLEQLV